MGAGGCAGSWPLGHQGSARGGSRSFARCPAGSPAAFDREGFRLGYGGGFYDRTLEKLRALKKVTAIGIAYAGQEMDTVPRDDFDQRLDWIMTEKETFKCG